MDNGKRMEIVPGHVGYSPDYKSDKHPKGHGGFVAIGTRFPMLEGPDEPVDDEVVQLVAGLKRSLSKRSMRYVVQELSRELGLPNA